MRIRPVERLALAIGLDEQAEAEALEAEWREAEWREAEALAAIMDGELTPVRGFEAFLASVLGAGPASPPGDEGGGPSADEEDAQ